jgi:hypothetical protein
VNLPAGSDDDVPASACVSPNSCDGAGHCRKDIGQACSSPGDCASGFCVDGYCCQNACTAVCFTCGMPGSPGVCQPILGGPDTFPAGACGGNSSCVNGVCTPDRTPCTGPGDCPGSVCTQFYLDSDGDGQGGAAGPRLCGTTPPPGHVATGGDCCDRDLRVRSSQTEYFSTPSACGSFDYNCSGGLEPHLSMVQQCNTANCLSGWGGPVPACGVTAPFMECHRTGPGGAFCDSFINTRVQACR